MNASIDKTVVVLVLLVALLGIAVEASADDWQERMLFNPSDSQLELEKNRGRIMIYDGMKDVQIAMALDEQFDRIEYMMFVGTVVTDEQGEVQLDPETGEAKLENDGC